TVQLQSAPVFSNGTARVTVALDTADTLTLTASSGPISGTSGGVIIAPAAMSKLNVSAPATATVGHGFSVAITAKDAFGTTVAGFAGSVIMTSSDGQTAYTSATPAFSNGTAAVTVTLNNPDTVALTATSGRVSSKSANIVVSAAPTPINWFSQNMSD